MNNLFQIAHECEEAVHELNTAVAQLVSGQGHILKTLTNIQHCQNEQCEHS